MNPIDQIYCTHCTYGSSALERRDGELAHRTLGYSARAGSVAAAELRTYYRQVERYLYYYLPRDTPAEEKRLLTDCTAPRRMLFLPGVDGFQFLAQVCYRAADSEGRPGSYFAHALRQAETAGAPRWSALDCLRLWQAAGWVGEDSPGIPFLLPALRTLDDMLPAPRAAIGDRTLRSFLTAPAGGPWDDPGHVIPARLRAADAPHRQSLLVDALEAFLGPWLTRQQPLLFVAEPDLAALLFYGLLRLLPDGLLRAPVSFSTYEPDTDRVCTTLSATVAYDPAANAELAGAIRFHGELINTFPPSRAGPQRAAQRGAAQRGAAGPYARTIVARLVQRDWPSLDRTLGELRLARPADAEDLQRLVAADRLVWALLDPASQKAPWDESYRRWPIMVRYLRQALCRKLAAADPAVTLQPVVGSASHLPLLELLAPEAAEHPEARRAVEFLLSSLPGPLLVALLKLDPIAADDKGAVLARYLTAHGPLPAECQWLWEHWAAPPAAEGDSAAPPLLAGMPSLAPLLARLEGPTLEKFYRSVPVPRLATFFTALKAAVAADPAPGSRLTVVVAAMDRAAIELLYEKLGPAVFAGYPAAEPAMGTKLCEMLDRLPDQATGFSKRLDLLLAAQDLLPEAADRDRVLAWSQCRQAILDLGRLQRQRSGWRKRRPLAQMDAACQRMVDAVLAAMPAELFPDDPPGTGKQKRLQEIGRCLLGEPLLPASQWHHVALWQKAGWYFGRGKWPSVALDTLRPKSRGKRQRQITLAILCAALTLIACIFLALLIPHGGSGPRDAGAQHGPSAGQAGTDSSAAAGRAPSARSAPESQPPSSAPLRTPTAAEVAAEGLDRERRSAQAESSHVGAMADADAERAAVAQMANEEQPLAAAVPAVPATRPAAAHAPAASADLSPDDRWRRPAKQFAEEHAGIVVDRQPLVRGSVAVGELTANSDNPFSASRIFLGPGKIWAAGQSYPFGPSWDAVTLSRSQEVPGLAQALGVPEVRLSVENTAKGFRLTLNWTPGLPTADPQVEARLEQLRERKMEIKERIEQIKSTRHVSDHEVEEAQKTLLEMLAIRLPDQPRQEEPRYANDPQAWSKARADYQGQRQEILARLTGRALSELLKIDAQMKRAQREGAQLSHQRIDERLSSLAQQVSAVVYRQAFKRESPPVQPTAGQVQQVRGEFSLSQRDFTPPPPAIARIRVQIVAEPQGGVIPLSAWREQAGLLVKCFLLPPGGRAIITEGATEFDPADVPAGVTELSVQLRFYQRGIFDGDEPQLVGQTAAQTLESIQAHKQYTLTFRIPADGWQPARNPFSRSPSK